MKNIIIAISTLLVGAQYSELYSQNPIILDMNSYNIQLPEGLVHFDVDTTAIVIKFRNNNADSISNKNDYFKTIPKLNYFDSTINYINNSTIGYFNKSMNSKDILDFIKFLQKDSLISYAAPILIYNKSVRQGVYDLFFVKLKQSKDIDSLLQLSNELNFTIEKEYEHNIYFCRANKYSIGNTFEIAKYLQNKNIFTYVEPDFIYTGHLETNDTYYNSQWALNNTGQFNGTSGADIDIVNAWTISTGSPNIKVAILDCFGSINQFNHPDITFYSNYDATGTGFNSTGFAGDAHGINCAGIIKATTNNSLGTAGVAYSCNVIAVKIATVINSSGSWTATGNSISDGITWAYQNADVISNSNNFGSSSSLIENAILNSITIGRNNLGTPFLTSSGNDNVSAMIYPAWNTNTIAVGATSMCDQRKSPTSCDGEGNWGSNYGTGLDIAAPGVHIYTTDINGSAGYVPGAYNEYFNGTSSACPFAAGVMALILSVNPNITNTQARNYLEAACEKVGGYTYNAGVPGQPNGTWSTSLGYGRINAFQALNNALEGGFCNNDYACGPPSPTVLDIKSSCTNSSCSTIGATPPSPNINFNGGSTCTTPYQTGRYDDDVWFKVTPSTSNPITIKVTPTSNTNNFDVVIGLYQGTCSSPTQVSCADLLGVGATEILSYTPTANTPYLIRVFSYGIGSSYSGDFDICVYSTCAVPGIATVSGGGMHCDNSVLIASGGSGGTMYWQGTTNNGTSTSTPSSSQTVTSPGTYYFRAHNSCGWGQQGSATVSLNYSPGAVTVSGGGTYCNNTILTASGGSGGTIYWQGTTSNGTSTSNPTNNHSVSSSGTYYFRAKNNCDWGTQGSATVTINTIPSPVSVSGGGTYCTSALLTASGGSGGTIYWQGTTSNGTSTSTPSSSQTVTSSGTYYFRANNACGWGNQGSASVTINPTIVSNTNDNGSGSLRDMIACAGSNETITFSLPPMSQITLTSGEININKNLTILGPGVNNLTISGNNATRIFHISSGKTLTLKDMSLKDGNAPSPNGGALFVEGNLNLENMLLDHNFENTNTPKALTIISPGGIVNMISNVEIHD